MPSFISFFTSFIFISVSLSSSSNDITFKLYLDKKLNTSLYTTIVSYEDNDIVSLISASKRDKSYFNASYLSSTPVPSSFVIRYGSDIYSNNPFLVL